MNSRQYTDMFLHLQIDPAEIEFCRHQDGSLWELGSGGYGHVSAHSQVLLNRMQESRCFTRT